MPLRRSQGAVERAQLDNAEVSHHHEEHADWTEHCGVLEREGEVSQPWVRDVIGWLVEMSRPGGIQRVIDIGSGPGVAACQFAEALPEADVVAFDANQALLDRALERATQRRLQDRLTVHQGMIGPGLADLEPAELVWCSRVVHHVTNPREGLAHLATALTDVGVLAVVEGGLPMRVLPGGYGVARPGFVSRLDAAADDYAREKWAISQEAAGGHRDWPLLMADSGLEHVASRTFLLDLPAPLDSFVRDFVVDRFADLHHKVRDRLSPEDERALFRLNDPEDPAALVNRPDLFLLSASTVHVARRG